MRSLIRSGQLIRMRQGVYATKRALDWANANAKQNRQRQNRQRSQRSQRSQPAPDPTQYARTP